jgi:hypothetical protein
MVIRTFFTQKGVVNRVIYELPHHEKVHKDTNMRLVMNKGNWYVVADLKRKVASSLAEDKHGVIHIAEMDSPVARD